MIQTIFLHVEEAVVAINVLVLHQVNDFIWVLVDVNDQLQLVLNLVLHELTCVRRVVKLDLNIINQFEESQADSQWVDVLPENTVLSWLAQDLLKNLHDNFGLLLLHEGSKSLQEGYLDLILGKVIFKVVP